MRILRGGAAAAAAAWREVVAPQSQSLQSLSRALSSTVKRRAAPQPLPASTSAVRALFDATTGSSHSKQQQQQQQQHSRKSFWRQSSAGFRSSSTGQPWFRLGAMTAIGGGAIASVVLLIGDVVFPQPMRRVVHAVPPATPSHAGPPAKSSQDANARPRCSSGLPLDFVTEAKLLLGDAISFDDSEPGSLVHDLSFHSAPPPAAVVRVVSAEQARTVVRLCVQYGVPITPVGAGTSLEGHTLASCGGIALDMSGLNRVLSVRVEDMDCTVEPGVTWEDLNHTLRPLGLFFPPDPGPGATIGGMISTRCSGPNAARYGTIRDNVISLEAIVATSDDAPVVCTGQRARKSSMGYDLTRLFIGAEGTLGVVTQATLKLQRLPAEIRVGICSFPSIRDAAAASQAFTAAGIQLNRCEMLDDTMVHGLITHHSGSAAVGSLLKKGIENFATPAVLLLEYAGSSATIDEQQRRVRDLLSHHSGREVAAARDPAESQQLWQARKDCLLVAQAMDPNRSALITDVCVPLSRFPEVIGDTKAEIAAAGLLGPIVAHAGDGNFHVLLMFDSENAQEKAAAERIKESIVMRALAADGTASGEHGCGIGKRPYLAPELGPEAVAIMRSIKRSLDPKWIMNPGKILTVDEANTAAWGCAPPTHSCQ
ncbi:hypothetical protein CAOG_09070 [Capsaspora owczarzaki ATCC 30864]|uniref:D-lactate dehydrogenase (cytochrome) n=1 Tax=Capsaspora owczarzaki (strain ATCC 30864) TaxID=595528 RepID=A0A0D2WXE8_CAPO3|nr:hypothetical protein CAOG_09070 [Capsaspora owczarzaki ATCC 30864]KJE97433.1 hypothetical protein CAOG_009070 [Capsaspora owczarzaki ATCC 30864]|eukprot:XP_011270803.1 hypothetical protein CAOG_09070 [Capsaspora owczarzaki ATCC 30864]